MTKRKELIKLITNNILTLKTKGVLKVAIDGVDGAGKTVFADELAEMLRLSIGRLLELQYATKEEIQVK